MVDPDRVRSLSRLLAGAGRAHHEATGGPNPEWATWYAEHLQGKIDEVVGFSPTVDTIANWLTQADEKHRAEAPERRWPDYYAELILATLEEEE